MKKLIALLLSLVMLCTLTIPALANPPKADLDPPLWWLYGYDSYEEMIDDYTLYFDMTVEEVEADYAEDLAYFLSFMETRPEETAQFRANAYDYYEKNYAEDYGTPEEYMSGWDETEEQFITDMAVMQIMDQRHTEEYINQWAQTCAEQPERTALFLEELDGWFTKQYYYYDSFEEYCEYRSCIEEAYVDLFENWNWYYEWEQAQEQERQEFITSHGGVPGQVNVMVNGKCLTPPAERPTYIKNGTTYVDAQTLSQALGAQVKANGSGYARLRSAAKAAGCRVWWDERYSTAVLIDAAALAEQIDKDFTIYNKVLAHESLSDQALRSNGSAKADLTLFDSLDGDKSASASFSYDVTASTAGASGTAEYDLSAFWALAEGYIPMPLSEAGSEDFAQQLALVRSLMKGKAEVRLDLENQVSYFSMSGLSEALNSLLAQYGVQLANGAWLSFPLDGLDADLEELIALTEHISSVGELFCAAGMTSSGYGSAALYDNILEAAAQAAELWGDAKFTRKGNANVLTLDLDDQSALLDQLELYGFDREMFSQYAYTLTVHDNGDLDIDMQCRMALNSDSVSLGDFVELTGKSTRRGGSSDMTMECHVKNILKLTMTFQNTTAHAQNGPELAPPAGSLIVPVEELSGGAVFSPDGSAVLLP